MRQFGEILGLQEREAKTILEFLRERMEGDDRVERRKTLAERLGLKGMGCCGGIIRGSNISTMEEDDHSDTDELGPVDNPEPQNQETGAVEAGQVDNPEPECNGEEQVVSGMNLADALAAERELRGVNEEENNEGETPLRMSLMRLLEETDGEAVEEVGRGGNDTVCCVCMGKKKGSAFIPCGHTFCRVCSRELWLNRGNCPLCNRQIIDILDIF